MIGTVGVGGKEGTAGLQRLCDTGRFGWDFCLKSHLLRDEDISNCGGSGYSDCAVHLVSAAPSNL